MLQLQKTILEMIARGDPLDASMKQLCDSLQCHFDAKACSVNTVGGSGLPTIGAASDDVIPTGAERGAPPHAPCEPSAQAADCGQIMVAVHPVAAEERDNPKMPAADTGCCVSWGIPIVDDEARGVGGIALHFAEERTPTASQVHDLEAIAHICAIAIERDRRAAEHERRASEDELTGLANRAAFNTLLASLSCSVPGAWALLAVDLDNLKPVNDTFGHHVGDLLLKVAAKRLSAAAAPARVFRVGGDEFMIVMEDAGSLRDPGLVASRILHELEKPADCAGIRIAPQASLGYAVLSVDDDLAETVRQNADHALYCAKETNRGGVVKYWPGLGTPITDRIRQIREIEGALQEGRIEAWYQPIVCLQTEQIIGLEAFCRVRTRAGLIKPAAAFDLGVSDAHVAYELTRRMLSIVAEDSSGWFDKPGGPEFVAINVSTADLRVPSLRDELMAILADCRIAPEHLVLDLNETTHLALRDNHALAVIGQLRASGIRIALDDFGSGLASLSHLMSVPVDIIKLDPSLTSATDAKDKAGAIISGMLDISRRLGLDVIAEAVETEQQRVWLQSLGCTQGQGYRFAAPLRQRELVELLQRPLPVGQFASTAVTV